MDWATCAEDLLWSHALSVLGRAKPKSSSTKKALVFSDDDDVNTLVRTRINQLDGNSMKRESYWAVFVGFSSRDHSPGH